MKAPAKTLAPGSDRGTDQPAPGSASNTLLGIVDLAIAFRFPEKPPSLYDLARLVSSASRMLHIKNVDERTSVEKVAVLELAKRGMS